MSQTSHLPAKLQHQIDECHSLLGKLGALKGEIVSSGHALDGVVLAGDTMEAYKKALDGVDEHTDFKIKVVKEMLEALQTHCDTHLKLHDTTAADIGNIRFTF